MPSSFVELFARISEAKRTNKLATLLALFEATNLGAGRPASTAAVERLLKLQLRGAAPRNISDVLAKAGLSVQAFGSGGKRTWLLTERGYAELSEATGIGLSKLVTNTSSAIGALHTAIREVSAPLLEGGHFSEAVGRSAKRLNQMVRLRTQRTRDDGTSMMFQVFSSSPNGRARLVLGELTEDWQKDRQEGLKMMMAGVQMAIANVDKHGELEVGSMSETLEMLAVMSFLARAIDKCGTVA